MGWWDGLESVRTLLGGLGLNAECEMQCQAVDPAQSGPRQVTAHN